MAVTARTVRMVEDLRTQLDTIVDTQARELVRAWATALDEVLPDLNAALVDLLTTSGARITRTQMLRSQRLMAAVAIIADTLEALAAQAGIRITGDLQQVIDTAGAAQASIIDSQLPPDSRLVDAAGWDRVDARQIEAIVTRSTQRIISSLDPLPSEVMAVVRRELIRGVAAGSNPRATAARMVRRVEGHVNGRWGLTRALNIARTETLDAYRAAARTSRLQHADVLGGWTWGCRLDDRSCPSCWAMHGTVFAVDAPGPEDHPQGRCVAIPNPKPWAELGIDAEEPPSLLPDASTKFDTLTVNEQQSILGPKRYSAWTRGEYPMDAWTARRANPDWRPSYQVSPAPSGGRRSRTAA